MGFRQYRRTSSGADAALHTLLYWLTIVTAPVWVPIVAIFLVYNYFTSSAEREAARHRMTTSEIEISSMQFDARSRRLSGRLRNKSTQFTVTNVGINVVLQDCDTAGCETIGQDDVDIRRATPPGQAR